MEEGCQGGVRSGAAAGETNKNLKRSTCVDPLRKSLGMNPGWNELLYHPGRKSL